MQFANCVIEEVHAENRRINLRIICGDYVENAEISNTEGEILGNSSSVSLNERQRKMLNKLMDGFDGKLTSSKWPKIAKCASDTSLRDIQDLIEKEILEKGEGSGRSTSYRIRV